MAVSGDGRSWAPCALLLLLLVPLSPSAGAQVPLPGDSVFAIQMSPDKGSVYVPYLGNAFVNVTVTDLSFGQIGGGPSPPLPSKVYLTTTIVANDTTGWVAAPSIPSITSVPGQVQAVQVRIQAGATINDPSVAVVLTAQIYTTTGRSAPVNVTFLAIAKPFSQVYMQFVGVPPAFHPDQTRDVQVLVSSQNYYPDMFDFAISGPPGWTLSPPSTLLMGPRSSQIVTFTLNAPDTPFFIIYPQTVVFPVLARSVTDPAAAYSFSIVVPFEGGWVPGWTYGHILLLLIGALVVTRESSRRQHEKRLERGRPLPHQMSPEEEARRAALKKSDPERAAAMEERLAILHKKRVSAWKQVYKGRRKVEHDLAERERDRHDQVLALHKEERREKKRESAAERRALKREEKRRNREMKRLLKRKDRAEKAAAKARASEEKRLGRERKAERRVMERRVTRLEKQRAIQEKKQAAVKGRQLQRLEKRRERLEKVKAKELRAAQQAQEKARKAEEKGRE